MNQLQNPRKNDIVEDGSYLVTIQVIRSDTGEGVARARCYTDDLPEFEMVSPYQAEKVLAVLREAVTDLSHLVTLPEWNGVSFP